MPRTGTSTERGYGPAHRRMRAQWAPHVAAGQVTCWRCTQPIPPGDPWDLGHDDDDPRRYRGPEHATCNRRAGAEVRNRTHPQPRTTSWWCAHAD